MTLEKLYSIIQQRIKSQPKGSYVASLYKQGEDKILQKIGEEATELILAVKGKSRKRIIQEAADLMFSIIMILAVKGIRTEDIYKELGRRHKSSLDR